MHNLYDRYLIILIAIPMGMQAVFAQNHIPNPSFEVQVDCPEPLFSNLVAEPWQNANEGSTDHFHTCAPPQWCGVPDNLFGWQQPLTGNAYGGGWSRGFPNVEYREYLMTPLTQPLTAGKLYYLSFYVSLADEQSCGIVPYGAYLVQTPPPVVPDEYLIEVDPQYEHTGDYLADYSTWMHMEGCILAQGGEAWIIFGNFNNHFDSPLDPACLDPQHAEAYYYLDDVGLYPVEPDEEFEVDIGGPFVDCFEVTVDPEMPGVFYWSDGTIGPTFTTNESGIYSFSVVDSCRLGTGTFEVVVLGSPVDLGPEDVQVCAGDVYTITLNEDYGEYIWSTGSTSHTIDITEPGEYSVTVDDGCLVSTAEIEVEFVEPVPDPIFGDDTHICNGGTLEINLDAIIGDFIWQDGSDASSYSISNAGTYAVTITNACGQVSDEIVVVEIVEPEVQLGPDTILCEGEALEINLDPGQGDYVWQDGNDDPNYTITTSGAYTVFVSNVCGSQSDQLNVSFVPALQLNLDGSINLCPAQLPYQLDATTPGAESYHWNSGSTQPQHQITSAGTYVVTVSNACFTAIDSVSIVISNLPPLVQLIPDTILCPGQTMVLFNTVVDGLPTWQDQSTADTFLVTTSGEYSLAVTNVCGTGSDTVNIQYQSPLTVDLGPDFSLCTNESFVLQPGNTGVSFLWQDMSIADSLVVSAPGIYHVTISDQCTSESDSVIVTINNNPPDIDLPISLNLCQGETITLEARIGGVSYEWQDGSQASSLVIISPGIYSLTVSSNCGVDEDSVVVIDLGPAPGVDLGNDVDLCEGETLTLSPDFSNVDAWTWHDGSTATSLNITAGGEISIQASNVCGIDYDTMHVNVLPAIPMLSLGNDTALCPGNAVILSINIPDVNITWSDGTQENSITVSDAGIYHVMIANSCGQAADTIEIAILPDAPHIDLGADHLWCVGDVIVFDPGVSDAEYLWQDGSTGITYTATNPGTIILAVSNSCGADADTVLIELNSNGPQVDLGPDLIGCVGEFVTIESGIAGVDYEWQDGSTASSFTTSTSETIILTISNNCGVDTDTVEVDLSGIAPEVSLGVDTSLCEGTAYVLHASGEAGNTIQWQDGSTEYTLTVTDAGIYSINETNVCGTDTDSISIEVVLAPTPFSLGADTSLCLGESILLTAPSTGDAILWFDGSNSLTYIADAAQVYTVQVSNQCGSEADAIQVFINDDVPQINLEDDFNHCPEEIVSLDVTQPFPVTYQWSTGEEEPTITIVTPGVYAITIFNECFTVQHQVVVTEDNCDSHIYIPNVFSPNGDGINDVFTISFSENISVLEITGGIYDRWGDLVFSSNTFPFTWNGSFNDQPLNPAVFCYRVRVKYRLRSMVREELLAGDISIIK